MTTNDSLNPIPDGDFQLPVFKRSTGRRLLLISLKILIAGAVVFFIIRQSDFHSISAAFLQADSRFVSIALLLLTANIGLQVCKWHYLVSQLNPGIRWSESWSSFLGGLAIGFITPGRVGDLSRALLIKDTSRTRLMGLAVIDRGFNYMILVFAGLGGWLYLAIVDPSPVRATISVLASLLVSYAGIALYFWMRPIQLKRMLNRVVSRIPGIPFRNKVIVLVSSFDIMRRSSARNLLLMAFLFQLVVFSQLVLLVMAFHSVDAAGSYAAASSALFAKSLLPVSFADIGIREGAIIYFFGKLGVEGAEAFNASILLFVFNLVIPGLVGLTFVRKIRLHRHDTVVSQPEGRTE